MKFGLYTPLPHISINVNEIAASVSMAGSSLPNTEVDAGFTIAKEIVVRADELGFDLALFAERMLGPDIESWLLAAAVGTATERIKIMTAVHPGLWHPAIVAKLSASLDRICSGRTSINLVTGWWEEEHLLFGGHPLQGDDRYLLAEEFAKVLRGYLDGDEFEFTGKYFNVAPVQFPMKSASGSMPELFAASRSDRGLDMVSEVADWWFVDYKPNEEFEQVLKDVQASIKDMKERSERAGRTVRFAMNGFAAVAETDELAKQKAEEFRKQDQGDPRFSHIRLGFFQAGFIGSYDTVTERIKRLEEAGVELCLFQFYPTLSELDLLGLQLIPRVNGSLSIAE